MLQLRLGPTIPSAAAEEETESEENAEIDYFRGKNILCVQRKSESDIGRPYSHCTYLVDMLPHEI